MEPPTDVSLALLLASAKFFRNQNYWAKDIIFLITEHEMLGMQAWLEAYHDIPGGSGSGGVLNHGELEARAGAIQVSSAILLTLCVIKSKCSPKGPYDVTHLACPSIMLSSLLLHYFILTGCHQLGVQSGDCHTHQRQDPGA